VTALDISMQAPLLVDWLGVVEMIVKVFIFEGRGLVMVVFVSEQQNITLSLLIEFIN
jgi:hypothetical protein